VEKVEKLEKIRRFLLIAVAIAAALLAMGVGFRLGRRGALNATQILAPEGMVVTVVNVGRGEASWFRTPSGDFVVIGSAPKDQARRLVRSLQRAGASKIALLVLPYAEPEALGGTQILLQNFSIQEAWVSGMSQQNTAHKDSDHALRQAHVRTRTVRAGDSKTWGDAQFTVLAPSGDFSPKRSPRNNSLVVRLLWRNQSFLWGGGMQFPEEEMLLERTTQITSHWLRAPDFASKESSSPEFLAAVSPQIIVLPCSDPLAPKTKEGITLPHPETLDRLEATGATVLRTEQGGNNLTFTSDGEIIEQVL
jgi:competence protein ComEC